MTRSFTIAPVLLALVAPLTVPLAAVSAQPTPSIARLVITPASRSMTAGDTMRLRTPGVYNLATTHNGMWIVATNQRDTSVPVFDVATGQEVARIPTTRKVVYGIAVSDDDRYAFISVEGVGLEPGTVDVTDLVSLKKVTSVGVGQQAGGIDFLRSEPVRR